ncbi:photosystem II protein PsbQ [Calothrix anomala FACHB-343]|uniref:Photosystem II protein PsbQ n=2 Tax=Calothrix TaxID=1186 RepID=A0ABR8A473_9CYAN|nr:MULTISPECIES: photosystem II protein PsbQ [Calothrix]MBD2194275.1 photosystem II protein PsbQ [Calothrix parietina FACHB-288]MBD2229850.1 photosystem II protein PsbQ [Calothrix anomala FACHB-343]
MSRQRSLLSLVLVLLATFLISCSSPTVAKAPPTYTTAQLTKIQTYVPEIVAVRDRAAELKNLIERKDWIYVGNFIHGPLAEARLNMTYVIPNLLPQTQPQARQIARDLFNHLVKIDQAASDGNSLVALNNYAEAIADLGKFLELVPETSSAS